MSPYAANNPAGVHAVGIRVGRRAQWAWALNGWGNHAFATTILVVFFPIFFDRYWAAGLSGPASTAFLGVANSVSGAAVMILAPLLGALADRRGWKKRMLGLFTVLGVIASAGLAIIGRGQWPWALAVFVIGSIGFFTSSSFFDALLMQVASPKESNRVSSFGYAVSYLGGGLIFLLDVVAVLRPHWFGLKDGTAAVRAGFVSVAIWWALFSLPLFHYVPEGGVTREPSGFLELRSTMRKIFRDLPVRNFLIGYWIYIDALGTIQQMAVNYGAKLGFPTDTLMKAMLLVMFVSFPASIAYGHLADRIGTRKAIGSGLTALAGVSVWSYFMHTVDQFYCMAAVVGLAQGGVQALSRSLFSRLIPGGQSGEYFGFYNMIGKFAAVAGPLFVGMTALVTGSQRLSVLPLAVAFGIGGLFLAKVDEKKTCDGQAASTSRG